MSLTDLQIRRLKAPEMGQKTYYDPGLPGFGVRVSQGGSKTFVVVYGKDRRRRSLGRYPELSLSDARILAKRTQADFALDVVSPSQDLPAIPFEAAREKFLADTETRTKTRTIDEYRRLLYRHFHFDCALCELTRDQVASPIEALKATPSEQKHAFVAIRTMMNWCVKRGFLHVSPVPAFTFRSKPRERVLSDLELAAVWHRAEAYGWPFGRIVQLLILTGQRRGEIVGLRRSWIDAKLICYPAEFVKNQRSHTIPLGNWSMKIIESLPETTDLLFPSRLDETKPYNGFSKSKVAFDRALNIAPYTLHDLRRTFSSSMARLGTPLHVTEKMLNHVSGTISGVAAVYNRHAYLDEMRQAYAAYEAHIHEIVEKYGPNGDSLIG
ncbi:tyrosine-type recombinase/integrase [Antarctobacter sp.]|uniref:tyrosine-type recombinase/integrase n=1 Tax=Antarctobacter sp. TaxID=1872577 RepID=UPI002B26D2CC|nr:tyrosine-type recombinase/integrase [Antarctobacter sp.]